MNPWRTLKRIGFLAVLGCWLGSFWLVYSKVIATVTLSWPAAGGVTVGLLLASALVLWAIFQTPTLPTPGEVQQVVADICAARTQNIKNYKGKLHFYFPPHWRTCKLGKEGWLLRPKGLGAPVGFSIWAVTRDAEFADTSFEGMIRNVEDMATHNGGSLDRDSVTRRQVAGVQGITYWQRDLKGHETLGFFWCYEDGDYEFLVDAYSRKHIELIRPAVEEFIRHFRRESR